VPPERKHRNRADAGLATAGSGIAGGEGRRYAGCLARAGSSSKLDEARALQRLDTDRAAFVLARFGLGEGLTTSIDVNTAQGIW
jgi:hypothetical protein